MSNETQALYNETQLFRLAEIAKIDAILSAHGPDPSFAVSIAEKGLRYRRSELVAEVERIQRLNRKEDRRNCMARRRWQRQWLRGGSSRKRAVEFSAPYDAVRGYQLMAKERAGCIAVDWKGWPRRFGLWPSAVGKNP